MHKVILDESLRAKLNNLDAEVEVCDESGRTVGHFLPEEVYMELLYASAKARYSDEELDRRRYEEGGSSLAEFWKRMEGS
jgi:hypothetical protein